MALGDTNTIGDVTDTLTKLLTDLEVTTDSPSALKGDGVYTKTNLYLYQVLENPFSKNQPWVTENSSERRYPPLALNLYYLLTPYASDPSSAHKVLSHAMRIFHDNSIIKGSQLSESLRLTVDQLAISLCPLKLEELTRIWNALQTSYRLSVCYEVRIVLIESEIEGAMTRVMTKIDVYSQR